MSSLTTSMMVCGEMKPCSRKRGIEHPHQRRSAPPHREFQVRQRGAGELLRIAVGEVLGVDVGKIGAHEAPPIQAALHAGPPNGAASDGRNQAAVLFRVNLIHC